MTGGTVQGSPTDYYDAIKVIKSRTTVDALVNERKTADTFELGYRLLESLDELRVGTGTGRFACRVINPRYDTVRPATECCANAEFLVERLLEF